MLQQQASEPLDPPGAVEAAQALGEGDPVGLRRDALDCRRLASGKFGIRQAPQALVAATIKEDARLIRSHQQELRPKHILCGESERINLQARHLQRHMR